MLPKLVPALHAWAMQPPQWMERHCTPSLSAGRSSVCGLTAACLHSNAFALADSPGTSRPSAAPQPRQLFDILPIRGCLAPGESEQVEVSFFAFPGVKAAATAVCHVQDGPDYQVW